MKFVNYRELTAGRMRWHGSNFKSAMDCFCSIVAADWQRNSSPLSRRVNFRLRFERMPGAPRQIHLDGTKFNDKL
jgi:hypothetical protein